MADVVKQGIIKANEDLEKENQEKLIQEVRVSLINHILLYCIFVYFHTTIQEYNLLQKHSMLNSIKLSSYHEVIL